MNSKSMNVMFVGVGGCGSNIAEHLHLQNQGNAEYICINTDEVALHKNKVSSKLLIGRSLVKGDGCHGDSELGKQSAELATDQIRSLVSDAAMVMVCAGMGGGTGGGAASVIAQIAADSGAKVVVLAVLPFEFEGARQLRAKVALSELPEDMSAVEFSNDNLMRELGGGATMEDAFTALNERIGNISKLLISNFEDGKQLYDGELFDKELDSPFISKAAFVVY